MASLVSAAPPIFSEFAGDSGFEIKFPPFSALSQGRNFEFEFHVYNISNGRPITDEITCYFHLYNTSGKHVYEAEDSTVSHMFDYSFDVMGTNFSRIGEYAYVVQCNNSGLGGFVETNFFVTESGTNGEIHDPQAGLSVILFLLAINIFAFILPFLVKFSENEPGNFMVRHLIWIGGFLLLWFNVTLIRTIAQKNNLGIDNFLAGYWWFFTLGTFVCVFAMCFVMVKGTVDLIRKIEMQKRTGDNDQNKMGKDTFGFR